MRSGLPLSTLALCTCVFGFETIAKGGTSQDPHAQGTEADSSPRPPSFSHARTLLWERGVKNAYPRWSNDGKRILYQTNRSGKWQITIMDADGSHSHAITDGVANDSFPDWSPDNRHIAFVSDREGNDEIFVMQADGTRPVNLTHHPARDIHPYWSPDGKEILFNSVRDTERLQVFEMAADGSRVRRLVDSPDDDTCARIAPAGDRILYLANLAVGQDDILPRKRDGSDPINLTKTRTRDGWPTWTPDGKRIVYSAATGGHIRLHVMSADGSGAKQLSTVEGAYDDARPSVCAVDGRIVFNREDGETIGICTLDLPSTAAESKAK